MNYPKVLALGMLLMLGWCGGQLQAQDSQSGDALSAVSQLNFTQNEFDNWAAGGEDSWSWQATLKAEYTKDQPKFTWVNNGKIAYGKSKIGATSARKATDEIWLESVLNYKSGIWVEPYVSASLLTQMTKGYQYLPTGRIAVSDFMDPGYLMQSAGLGYTASPAFKTRLGAALKETITSDYPVPYADDPTTSEVEKTKVEFGLESVSDAKLQVSKLIVYTSRLALFSTLQRFDETDVDWDNLFSADISRFLTVTLNVKIYYESDISDKRQLKQTLAVGMTYNLL